MNPEIKSFQAFSDAVYTKALASAQKRKENGTITIADIEHAVHVMIDENRESLTKAQSMKMNAVYQHIDNEWHKEKTAVTEFLLKISAPEYGRQDNATSIAAEVIKIFHLASTEPPERWEGSWTQDKITRLKAFGEALQNMSEAPYLNMPTRKALDIATKRFANTLRDNPTEVVPTSGMKLLSKPGGFDDLVLVLKASMRALKVSFMLWIKKVPYKKREVLLIEFSNYVARINKLLDAREAAKNPIRWDFDQLLEASSLMYAELSRSALHDPVAAKLVEKVEEIKKGLDELYRKRAEESDD